MATKLKLQPARTKEKFYSEGIGGTSVTKFVVAKDVELGGQSFHNVAFSVDVSGSDGLLSQKFLRLTDAECDLLNGVVRLIQPEGCGDAPLAYWRGTQDVGVIDIERASSDEPHIFGKALIDGYHARVLFDSGANKSMLSRPAAAGAGVWPSTPGVIPGGLVGGVGGGEVPTWIAQFKEFKLDTETIRNPKLRIGGVTNTDSLNLPGRADMVLGVDFFLSHRVYVSYQQRKLYFTYNGGPVFNLTVDPSQRVLSSTADLSQPLPRSGSPSKDAAQYARRARALQARNQYDLASAAFEQAMQLAPTDAQYA